MKFQTPGALVTIPLSLNVLLVRSLLNQASVPAVSVPRMYPGEGGGRSMVRALNRPSFLNCLVLFPKGSNPS